MKSFEALKINKPQLKALNDLGIDKLTGPVMQRKTDWISRFDIGRGGCGAHHHRKTPSPYTIEKVFHFQSPCFRL